MSDTTKQIRKKLFITVKFKLRITLGLKNYFFLFLFIMDGKKNDMTYFSDRFFRLNIAKFKK